MLTVEVTTVQTVFPSMRYMCRLWPVRAVERFADVQAAEHRRPANPVLVLGSDMNPLVNPRHTNVVLQALRGSEDQYHEDASVVVQTQFGVRRSIGPLSILGSDSLEQDTQLLSWQLHDKCDIGVSAQWHGMLGFSDVLSTLEKLTRLSATLNSDAQTGSLLR